LLNTERHPQKKKVCKRHSKNTHNRSDRTIARHHHRFPHNQQKYGTVSKVTPLHSLLRRLLLLLVYCCGWGLAAVRWPPA